jgi:competence protein ComEA
MPRPRVPVPPDPERLSRLLAAAREARRVAAAGAAAEREERVQEPARGWVPDAVPPEADTSWLDDPWGPGADARERLVGRDTGMAETVAAGTRSTGADSAGVIVPPGRHRRGPRLLTVPTPLRGAQLTVPWRAVVALLLVVIVAGLFFAVRVARAQEAAAPQVVPAGGGLVGRSAPPTAFGTMTGGATAPTPGASSGSLGTRQLVVDVIGQVQHPGVVSVADGSRVTDVLAAVGGALPDADVQRLNLARLVTDGEQLFVPKPGETPPSPLGGGGGGGGGGAGGGATGPGASAAGGVVDLNTATLAALDGLPGVGPVLAQRILDWRTEHGRFTSVDELGEVSGIGDKLLGQIRPKVRV